MKFNLFSAFVSLSAIAGSVNALSCDQANRFGNATVTPTNPKEGDTLTILADFRCAIQDGGNPPVAVDYSLQVLTGNNGFDGELPIVLGRHTLQPGAQFDNITATIPHALFKGGQYTLIITNTHTRSDINGQPYLVEGSFETTIAPIVGTSF